MSRPPGLSPGDLLDHAVALYRRRFGALLAIQLLTAGPPTVLVTYLESAGRRPGEAPLVFLLLLGAVGLLGAWEVAASVRVALGAYLGHPLGAYQALGRSLPSLAPLVPLLILPLAALTFAPDLLTWTLGLCLLYVALWAATIAVAEQLGPWSALARLARLTEGVRPVVAGLALPVAALAVLPSFTVVLIREGVAALLTGQPGAAARLVALDAGATALGALLWLAVFPLWYCFIAVAYVALRGLSDPAPQAESR